MIAPQHETATAPAFNGSGSGRQLGDILAGLSAPMDRFRQLAALGFELTIPIIPPDAELSPGAPIAAKSRGKAPGMRGRDGRWHGLKWVENTFSEDQRAAWHAMGAGTGIMTGRQPDGTWLVAIDADTLNSDAAEIIRLATMEVFGPLPCRIGRAPKALYVIRVEEEVRYAALLFGADADGRPERVELLSDKKQFVAFGQHPFTREPYRWPVPLVPYSRLPVVSAAALYGFLDLLRTRLPAATVDQHQGAPTDRKKVDQDRLKAKSIDLLCEAVGGMPNPAKEFGSWEAFVTMAAAIRAATVDDPERGYQAFEEWFSRYEGPGYDPEAARRVWDSFSPVFGVGADYVFSKAARLGTWNRSREWHEPVPSAAATPSSAAISWIDPTQWEGVTPKPREWEVEGWIPRGEVTLLYGDGGIGKTLLAHQYATCAATGRSWLGQVTRPARVLCFFCEDSAEELHRRQIDINRSLGVTHADLSNLRIASRKHEDNLFTLWDRNTGAMQRQAVWERLRADALDFRADVVIVDTIADTYSGSEIDRAQVSAFVKSCLGMLAREIGGSVIALGHPSRVGQQTGTGTSGSTAWSNAARSRLYLRFPPKADRGDFRELEGMKSNYGPKGNTLKIRWHAGAFEAISSSAQSIGPEQLPQTDDAAEKAVVGALISYGRNRLAMGKQSQYFAPKVLKAHEPDALAAFSAEEVESALKRLLSRGAIKAETVDRDASRRPVPGIVVVADRLSTVVTDALQTSEVAP